MTVHYVTRPDDLERSLEESRRGPVWILKHSEECGLSGTAFDHFTAHSVTSRYPHWILVVQELPEVSRRLASLVRVQHETPQALLIVDGAVKWNASHRAVTAEAMTAAESSIPG